jgi:hypothetical protein
MDLQNLNDDEPVTPAEFRALALLMGWKEMMVNHFNEGEFPLFHVPFAGGNIQVELYHHFTNYVTFTNVWVPHNLPTGYSQILYHKHLKIILNHQVE